MVRSPRCALAGAQPGSAAQSPGSAALAAARLAQRRGEKATGGGAGGGGRQPQVPGRKFLQGEGCPLRSSRPPHTPWKFSGNYFQPPPALSCTSKRTKPFLLGVRGLASWEEGRVSASPRSAAWSSARSEPQKWWESPRANEPPGAAGLAALATPVLLKEWLVLR